jgi:hypothetical protein
MRSSAPFDPTGLNRRQSVNPPAAKSAHKSMKSADNAGKSW